MEIKNCDVFKCKFSTIDAEEFGLHMETHVASTETHFPAKCNRCNKCNLEFGQKI